MPKKYADSGVHAHEFSRANALLRRIDRIRCGCATWISNWLHNEGFYTGP